MQIQQWLELTANQLQDYHAGNPSQQFVRWSKAQLLSFFNDAACYIANMKPNDFLVTQIVKLVPGTTQTVCCPLVGTVREQVDVNGNFISRISVIKDTPTWRGSNICHTSTYKPQSVSRTDGDNSTFVVNPPVPATGDYYVKIRCATPPTLSTDDLSSQMPTCKYMAAINEWVMYRAFSGENDSALTSLAQLHYKAFFDLMGSQQKIEDAMKKAAMA